MQMFGKINLFFLNRHCVASNVPIIVKEIENLDGSFGRGGGFICVKGSCTSCQVGQYSNKISMNCISCPAGNPNTQLVEGKVVLILHP